MFSDIRVLIWDFDGTLYRPNVALWHDVREGEYKTIMKHTGWDRVKIMDEFGKLHKKKIASATQTVAYLCNISTAEAAIEMEEYFDRRKYLARDEKLIELFSKLKGFRHLTLANGVIQKHIEALAVLGLSPETFELMVTSEVVGETKPNERGYRYILTHTKLPAPEHLMIGDREAVDLIPAKKLGMKTCLVWSNEKSTVADVTLPTVYDVPTILEVEKRMVL
jgi:HAD superfamily hydrolase (TIGR01549 family)